MLSALLLSATPWRRVGWRRTLAALAFLVLADVGVGVAFAAMVGARKGGEG